MNNEINNSEALILRPVEILLDYQKHPLASVLIKIGGTRVVCAVGVEERVPPWMRHQNVPGGWLTAEYQMLPSSTPRRGFREAVQGKLAGRTQEIQRLIGRSLRAMVDLKKIGARTLHIDCDVLDADGGTRCASITGAALAVEVAVRRLFDRGMITEWPLKERVAAVSVGLLEGEPILDLCYEEDSAAEVDMNVIMAQSGCIVEIQAAAEERNFSRDEMNRMLDLAERGIRELFEYQERVLGS